MKSKFTMVKAASVMLVAFGLGTSCQKEATAPNEPTAVTSKASAQANASMDGIAGYAVTDRKGENVGTIVLYENEKSAAIKVEVNNNIETSAATLSAWLINKDGERTARLAGFVDLQEGTPSVAGTRHEGFFTSFTDPVVHIKSGNELTVKDLQTTGYEIIIVNRDGTRLASGALR
jgi:hypothetical protein